MLSTENATVGTAIEEKRLSEPPLNGRNFFSLVALAPNVAFGFLPAQQASGAPRRYPLHAYRLALRRSRDVGELYSRRHHKH